MSYSCDFGRLLKSCRVHRVLSALLGISCQITLSIVSNILWWKDLPDFSLLSPLVLTIFNNFQLLEEQGRYFEMSILVFLCQSLAVLSTSGYHRALSLPFPAVLSEWHRDWAAATVKCPPIKRVHYHSVKMREIKIQDVAADCIRALHYSFFGPVPATLHSWCLPGAARCWTCLQKHLF